MNLFETLSNEHGLIRQHLDNLALAGEMLEGEMQLPREFFEKSVQFARQFTDKYHHFKEEHVLFVRLAQVKKGAIDPELDTLRYQHERGRELISTISDSLDGYENGDPIKTTTLVESLGAYGSLLRRHIHLEDHLFFRMAEEEIPASDLESIQLEFDKAKERQGSETFEESHKLVVDMGSILTHLLD
jgi:hemerythrin-like domain-containing protein